MTKAYEGDYEFGMSDHVDRGYRELSNLTPEYVDIGRTFKNNMDRIMKLGWLPMELCFWSGLLVHSHCFARQRLGLAVDDYSKDNTAEFHAFAKSAWDQCTPTTQNPKDPFKPVWDIGGAQLKMVLKDEIESSQEKYRTAGIEAILAAMITASYAAFEALAVDLWVAAVDKHSSLASNWTDKNKDKSLTVAELSGVGFNLSNSMGTILTRSRKVAFQSFKDVRSAYDQAFHNGMGDVFSDTTAIYQAEKVRHLIAHRSGLVDEKFQSEMKGCTEYKDVSIGTQIPFNGPLAAKHIDACSRMGTALFMKVDAWSG